MILGKEGDLPCLSLNSLLSHESFLKFQIKGFFLLKCKFLDFPCAPGVTSNAEGVGSIPDWGAKIRHASLPKKQNGKQKQYHNKFSKDF